PLLIRITGILISQLFFRSHFQRIKLTLRYRAEVVVRLNVAVHHLYRMVSLGRSADFISRGKLGPLLRADQVVPPVPFAEVFTRPLGKDVVDINDSRCSSHQCGAVIFNAFGIGLVVPTPFAGTRTDHIDQFPCTLSGHRGSTLDGRFGSDEVEFRELGDVERACAGCVRLTQSGTIVGPIRTQLPKTGIHQPGDSARVDHIVGPSRKHAGANVAGARAVRVNDVGSFSLVVQECKNWIAGTYREVVRVVQHFIGHTTLRPVAAVYGGEGSVVAGIHRLVGKGVSDRADGRGHADPRTTQRLYGLTLYGAGRS